MMFISCPTIAEGQKSHVDSSAPSAIIAVLAVLLLLTVIAIIMFFVMREKKKSEHDNTIAGDGNVHNLNPSAHSCIPTPDNCKEDFEQQAYVDNQHAAAASTSSEFMGTIMRN